MGLVGVEPILVAMEAALKNGMAAKVAALNAEYADAYTLATIAADAYYWHLPSVEGGRILIGLPAIVLITEPATPGESNPDFYETHYSIVADVLVRGTDGGDVTRRCLRYNRAVKEILAARNSLSISGASCTFAGEHRHETTEPASGDYLQDFASRWYITRGEYVA
ncbi:MAG: hypothetical protein PHV98_06175 [Candidatus Omnitrophica bacterium]|nr:hypothetical protein [Candidatus Omnitrophota bacterium]